MARRLTTEQFIEKSMIIHNGKYSYEKSVYFGRNVPITIFCPTHGYFEQLAGSHMSGCGCRFCAGNVQYTTAQFKNFAQQIHGDNFNYDEVVYTGIFNKVKIKCLVDDHGYFEQTPDAHLNNCQGCPKCSNNKKIDQNYFIEKSTKIHNEKYSYENSIFVDRYTPVEIICPIHGIFFQKPKEHVLGSGCQKCAIDGRSIINTGTLENFIKNARNVHGDTYIYDDNCVYINYNTKLKIKCRKLDHGYFLQSPEDHINGGCGCPKCNYSKGEKLIHKVLTELNVYNIPQFSFIDCRNKYPLPFDFYIEVDGKFGLLEFQGKQHYEIIEYFGGIAGFEYRKNNDNIKLEYCKNKNIPLLLIHYTNIKNIELIIIEFLKNIKTIGINI